MGKRTGWTKIRHAYVCGDMSYRELAAKFGVSFKTLQEVAKKEEWVKKRRQFRDEVGAQAYTRARDEAVDELGRIRSAADRLGRKLDEIMEDEDQLYMHAVVLADAEGGSEMFDRKMKTVNTMAVRDLAKAMKDMTAVLRDLHGISTKAEEQSHRLAREKLTLEKKRFELEKEKSAGSEAKEISVDLYPLDREAE